MLYRIERGPLSLLIRSRKICWQGLDLETVDTDYRVTIIH